MLGALVAATALPAGAQPRDEATAAEPAIPEDEPGEVEPPDDPTETSGAGSGRSDEPPTRREARLIEQYGLGTPAVVHRLTSPGGVTPRYMRAAGGEARPAYLSYPIPGGRLARGFGSGTNGRHKALDIVAEEGTPIRAAERGLVVYADDTIRGYGWMAVILHPGGWVTFYAHCKKLLVRPGQTVERRDVVARVGDSGIARGHHLHFTLFVGGVVTDPYPFFRPPPPTLPHVGPAPHRGHRVRRGDSVASIARRFEVDDAALRAANGIGSDEEVREGWQILIPGQREPRVEDSAPGDRYTVREGDTLSEIARRFGTTTEALADLNRLADGAVIRPGQALRVPGRVGAGEPASGGGRNERPDTGASDVHVVGPGETLARIARRSGVPVEAIVRANRLGSAEAIREGQELVIPRGGTSGASEAPSPSPPARTYTVRAGDSLGRIARRHGCSVQDILDLNPRLRDPDSIRPGDELRVP